MKIRISDELNRTIEVKEISSFFELEKLAIKYEYWEFVGQ